MNYDQLPSHIQEGARRYIEHRILPGRFLRAVICNDLKESFGCADEINLARMFDIVSFFYNEAPASCWGSYDAMQKWVERIEVTPH